MEKIKKILNNEINETIRVLNKILINKNKIFYKLCEQSLEAVNKNKKIIFAGNGGSAADSMHLCTELEVRYKKKRKSIPALSLASNNASITAISNDFNFRFVFSRQLEGIGNAGDILILMTTSGNSQNLIEAAKLAKKKKMKVFCLSGNGGGKIKKFLKQIIIIPSKTTSIIQICELTLGHILSDYLEKNYK